MKCWWIWVVTAWSVCMGMGRSGAYVLPGGKLDDNGKFQRLLGVTIVSMLSNPDDWAPLYDAIVSSRLKYFLAPLPPSSYHMTIFPLYTQWELSMTEQEWLSFSNSAEFRQKLHSISSRLSMTPLHVVPSVQGLAVGSSVVAVVLSLPDPVLDVVREFQMFVANTTGIQYDPEYVFHMSLGYWFKMPAINIYDDLHKLEFALGNLCLKRTRGQEIVENACFIEVEDTALVEFDSMTAFTEMEFPPTDDYVPRAEVFPQGYAPANNTKQEQAAQTNEDLQPSRQPFTNQHINEHRRHTLHKNRPAFRGTLVVNLVVGGLVCLIFVVVYFSRHRTPTHTPESKSV
ncbi:hypothetical protein Pelo_12433 [Pelomyxa schiedti]|nr:hypothetical protein Pelo_12433 [Pelomyxa schiedti]